MTLRIGGDVTLDACSTPMGNRLKLKAARFVPEDNPDDDGAVALDDREVEELRDACDEYLTRRRV